MRRYPHQLSGGMQQRVVIAMALAKDPTLLILDEPTTGLDATVEAEVLDLVAALRAGVRTSVLFISHNLDVIASMCDRVGVLYAGRLVEEGAVERGLPRPAHPYAVGLLRCIPRGGVRKDRARLDTIPGFLPELGAELPAASSSTAAGSPRRSASTEEPPLHDARRRARQPLPLPEQARRCRARRPRPPVAAARSTQDAAAGRSAPRTCARPSTRTATRSARSRTSRRRCAPARRSASSASRAAARRPSRACCSA